MKDPIALRHPDEEVEIHRETNISIIHTESLVTIWSCKHSLMGYMAEKRHEGEIGRWHLTKSCVIVGIPKKDIATINIGLAIKLLGYF